MATTNRRKTRSVSKNVEMYLKILNNSVLLKEWAVNVYAWKLCMPSQLKIELELNREKDGLESQKAYPKPWKEYQSDWCGGYSSIYSVGSWQANYRKQKRRIQQNYWLFAMTACTSRGPSVCDFHSPPLVCVQTNVSHSSDEIIQPN